MQELRTTTGQRIRIAYDPSRNQLTFHEDDWSADPFRSSGAPIKSSIVRLLAGPPAAALAKRGGHVRGRAV